MHNPANRAVRASLFTAIAIATGVIAAAFLSAQTPARAPAKTSSAVTPREFFDTYCITCHDSEIRTAGLALDTLDLTKPDANAATIEKVIVKLRAGSMPPQGNPRADAATYRAVAAALERNGGRSSLGRTPPNLFWGENPAPSSASTAPNTTTPSATCSRSIWT